MYVYGGRLYIEYSFIAGILFAIIAAIAIISFIRQYRVKRITETSLRIAMLEEINESYSDSFISLHDLRYNRVLNSKAQFDRFSAKNFFVSEIAPEDTEILAGWCQDTLANQKEYALYCEELATIPTESQYRRGSWRSLEDKLIDRKSLHPVTRPSVRIAYSYTSPKGRNHYSSEAEFSQKEVTQLLLSAKRQSKERRSRKATIARERAAMTPKLRYEILARDGFRCVLCGSAASDDVKLEVDHIIPVSRGGRTTPDNLQTLCDRCNQGKGASL